MAEQYISEIRLVAFNYPPKGWAFCNGQLLPINQYQALFSLIGTYYGGNGTTNFALPNLQGASPIHMGNGFSLGNAGGQATVTLNTSELPAHTHTAEGVSTIANLEPASGNAWAAATANPYAPSSNVAMGPGAVAQTGGSQPHNNMPPYLVMSYIIALQGIFPSRN